MSYAWYVIHSKPNREDFLCEQLRSREIEVFYPCLHVKPVNPRSRKIKAFFPGYLFVNVDLEVISLSSIAYVPGANRVVSFDNEPATVPEEVIASIRKNVDRINQASKTGDYGLKHGDRVIITDGPFKGFEAIFDTRLEGTERVRLLIHLLHGQQRKVQVPANIAKPKKS
jgi:transcriptional antiterminator RfaH